MAQEKKTRSRKWVFTLNNYTADDLEQVHSLPTTYWIYGKEVGETGTPHLQGCMFFKSARTLGQCSKLLPRAFIETMAGTPAQAIEYCKKDGDWSECGTPPLSQEAKGDLEKARWKKARLAAEAGDFDSIDDDIFLRHYANIKKIKADYRPIPECMGELDFHWYVGPTGCGKTRKAWDENPGLYKKLRSKWWDNYNGEDCVLIDEWSPDLHMLASHLKEWCDHYPFRAETKGGTITIRPKKLIITSNYTIEECFPNPQDCLPLLRRFNVTTWTE